MALVDSFEKSGNFFFRNRGYVPLTLFVLAVPVIYLTGYNGLSASARTAISLVAIAMSLAGFLVRAITIGTTPKGTSGRNTAQQVAEYLNHEGIYSVVRHPLYLGNYLMWSGIVIYTYNIWFFIVFSLAYWLYYERIMFAEERFLERKYGNEFLGWSRRVPAFVPSFSRPIPGKVPFSLKSLLRREYSGFLATVASYAFVDHLRLFFTENTFIWYRISTFAFGAALLITLVLRSLKHYSKLLADNDRS